MTPKEKARDLIAKYMTSSDSNQWQDVRDVFAARRCASIAVHEIIDAIDWHEFETPNKEFRYWIQVEQELYNQKYKTK